ncbi:Peptidase C19 ubiquitin carboxyl-terminal hydrolase, partial [Trinorchestia longiramus]
MCLTPKRDDSGGGAPSNQRGAESSNTSEGRSDNSGSSVDRSSSSPSKGTSNVGGAPVLKLKSSFTTSIASKFGGTTPVFPKPVPTSAPRRDSKDSIPARKDSVGPRRDSVGPRRDSVGPRRDSVGPRRDSIGSVSLKKFENNSSSSGVEFTAIKLKKVSKVSSSSVQEEKTKTTGVKTAVSTSEGSTDEIRSEDGKTESKDSKSVNENGPKKCDSSLSSKSSTNDVGKTSNNEKLHLESKSYGEGKNASVSSIDKTEPRVRHIRVERETENGNATDSKKRDKSLDVKDSSEATKTKLTSMSVTSKVKVRQEVTDSSDQVPCLKLSVSGSVSSSSSVTSSSKIITSESSTFASSNSLCRSATIKSTEIPTIASQSEAAQEAKSTSTGKKTKKLSDEKGDQKSASMTDKPVELPATQTPESRASSERLPDVLKRSLPGEVAFSPKHALPDICASKSSAVHIGTGADVDTRTRSVQPSSPSISVSSLSNISSSVCSVSTASSSPVCSLSAASSSSQSVCSLSNATDTLSTSISTSASDLSVSPPPSVTLPLASSMATLATAADTSTTFTTASTLPSVASTTTTPALPPTSTCISGDPAIVIVRDMSSIAANINRTTIKAPASSTIGALFAEVGHKFGYEPDSFSLSLQSCTVTDPLERLSPWLTLEEANFQIDGVSRNSLLLMDLRNSPPKRTDASGASGRDDDLALGASASPSSCGGEDSGMYSSSSTATKEDSSSIFSARSKRLPADSETTHEYTSYSSTSSLSSKHDTGYVGLVNQAMTCYLNSLLQTLFMTPEFRNALYRWEFKGSKEEASKSIPYQLQKLFLLLQTADRSAIETTSLTKSFGWDSSEAWQQHDIQELCRVMFEALEQSFANTDQANLIDTLYQGKMKDYVKCLVCGNENARMDSFLDIPLPIRPFGSSTAYQSLEEALRAFVAPELLSGNNQYQCSKCNAMCDAHKGLKFTKYPYLLTIHLKRFDFDYQTFHRIKLNDRVTFPNVLDLSEFLDDQNEKTVENKVSSSSTKSDSAVSALDDSATDDSGSALDTEDSSVDFTPTHNCDDDEGIELSASDTEKNCVPEGLKSEIVKGVSTKGASAKGDLNGPKAVVQSPGAETNLDSAAKCESGSQDVYTNYQLFSIMIHSGSASGGHYYAYIRDFLSGDWFCFNDQSVTRIGDDEIKRTYGGGGRSGSGYGASANAYMLMYRQCNEQRNNLPFAKDNFPSHIQKLCENLIMEEELEKEAREREKCTCVIKLFCQHPSATQLSDMKLRVHKDTTLAEATKRAHELLDLHKSVPLERCRLVKYEEYHDSIESSFEDQDDKPMSEVLGGVKSSYKFDLLMEVREEHQQFESYQPGGVSFKVFIVNLSGQGEVDGPFITRGLLSMTVAELKKAIAASLNLNSDTMRIASEGFYEEMKFLSDDAALLRSEGFYKSNKLFVEASGEESTNFYVGSQMASIIERYHNTITLYCTLPVVTPAILEELNIPPHVEDRPSPALANSSVQ